MSPTVDPFEDLADLFLTTPAPSRSQTERRTFIDVVMVGHLPVRAGLWLTPYADWCAQSVGATALVRLDRPSPTIELVRGRRTSSGDAIDASFLDALDDVALDAAMWVVRPPLDADFTDIVRAEPDRVTILSGADEAAIVAAYQLIKKVIDAAEMLDRDAPEIGVAILGSEEAVARRAVERLGRTTSRFLHVEIPLVAAIPRMDAAAPASRFVQCRRDDEATIANAARRIRTIRATATLDAGRSPTIETDADVAARVTDDAPPIIPPPKTPPPPATPPTSEPTSEPPAETTPAEFDTPPTPAAASPGRDPWIDAGAEVAKELAAGLSGIGDATPEPTVVPFKLDPKPVVELEPKMTDPPLEPDCDGLPRALASYVDGLTPLATRCPDHDHVEVAVDAAGRLHVLGHENDVAEMHIVARWAHDHAELISRAFPGVTLETTRPARLHVFTSEPARVSKLHNSDIALHVLAPVRVGEQTGWYAAPLNTPRG